MDRSERARSFGAVAAEYAEHRPGYAAAAVGWAVAPVVGGERVRLLDLAAGTGKLTAALLAHGGVVAVEPDGDMLAELQARFPAVDARKGTAEQIPVADSAVDAVLVGQAWHWFDHDRALAEAARVLRPGGVLAVLWNREDTRADWVPGYLAAVDHLRPEPRARVAGSLPSLPAHPAFGHSRHSQHPNPVRTTVDGLLAALATHSWALVADPEQRERAFAGLRGYLAGRPETGSGEFELPLVTEAIRVLRK